MIFSDQFQMKTIKIVFFTGFWLLLFSLIGFNSRNNKANSETINIQQSPLSDDETNPIKKQFLEFAEFELEENDDFNSTTYSDNFIHHFADNNIHQGFQINHSSFSGKQYVEPFNPHFLHSSQSYLNVFRI